MQATPVLYPSQIRPSLSERIHSTRSPGRPLEAFQVTNLRPSNRLSPRSVPIQTAALSSIYTAFTDPPAKPSDSEYG